MTAAPMIVCRNVDQDGQKVSYVEVDLGPRPRGTMQAKVLDLYVEWLKANPGPCSEHLPNVLMMGPKAKFDFVHELIDEGLVSFSGDDKSRSEYRGMKMVMVVGEGDEFMAVGRI